MKTNRRMTTTSTAGWLKIRTDRPSSKAEAAASMTPGWRTVHKDHRPSNLTGLSLSIKLIISSLSHQRRAHSSWESEKLPTWHYSFFPNSRLNFDLKISTTFQSNPRRSTPGRATPAWTTRPPNWKNSDPETIQRPSSFLRRFCRMI